MVTKHSTKSYQGSLIDYVPNERYKSGIIYPFLSSIFEVDGIRYVPVSPSERTCDAIDCINDERNVNVKILSEVSYKGVTMKVREVKPYICYNNKYIEKLEYEFDNIPIKAFESCNNLREVKLGNNISLISDSAFAYCSNLTKVTFGNNISSIGVNSFSGCSSLKSVIFPNSLTSLGNYSFSGCSSLADIKFGSNLSTIGWYAFEKCSSLTNLTIPSSVKSINNYAFDGCTGIRNLIISDREEELSLGSNGQNPLFSSCPLDSVYIGGNITYKTGYDYGYSPFYRNSTLRTVVIADRETEISNYEFYGCSNLQNISFGDGVTSIGDWAFSGCSSLKKLSLGSKLEAIGKEAFSDCSGVTQIVSKSVNPPACGAQALDDISKWDCKLFVPNGSMKLYQEAEQWKDFFFIEEGTGGSEGGTEILKCAKPTISYSQGKLTFNCETDGATCLSTITDSDISSYTSNEVQLGVTYNIRVYATKFGYEDSDYATATLCWIDVEPKTEGITNGVANIQANPVVIQTHDGELNISGVNEGTDVAVYSVSGQMVASARAVSVQMSINTNLKRGDIAIIKIGEKSVKVLMQ